MNASRLSPLAGRSAAVALALTLATGQAVAGCAGPQQLTALRIAALRQQLMVAALACHEAPSFNRFVTANQDNFLESDRALADFFDRGNGGSDAYNAYKTRQANDASLRSLHDPMFCGDAASVFRAALSGDFTLAELAAPGQLLLRTGFHGCTRDDTMRVADAGLGAPAVPVQHHAMTDASNPPPAASTAPITPAAHQGVATVPPQNGETPPPPNERDAATASAGDEPSADESYGSADSVAGAYDGGSAPATYSGGYGRQWQASPYGGGWYGYPQPMRQVQGSDGRWYLMPPGYGR